MLYFTASRLLDVYEMRWEISYIFEFCIHKTQTQIERRRGKDHERDCCLPIVVHSVHHRNSLCLRLFHNFLVGSNSKFKILNTTVHCRSLCPPPHPIVYVCLHTTAAKEEEVEEYDQIDGYPGRKMMTMGRYFF